jgi:branched-subunit amino acid transport protein
MTSRELYIWAAVLCLALATYLPRAILWILGSKLSFSRPVESALRYAPAAALAGIVAPALLVEHGSLATWVGASRVLAAAAATICFLYTRSLVWTIACGMGAFTVARLLAS